MSALSRKLVPLFILTALAAVFVVVQGGGRDRHQVGVTVPNAVSVVPGQEVRVAGQRVGSVDSVEPVAGGRRARIVLNLGEGAWPLPDDSRMELRWGGTVSFNNRYIALRPGKSRSSIADGGSFPAAQFDIPVELDSFVDAFDAPTRAGLASMLRNVGLATRNARGSLRNTLEVAPAALAEVDHVLADVGADGRALQTMVRSGAKVVEAALRSDPDLAGYTDAAARMLTATGSRASAMSAALTAAPRSLTTARETLQRADTTLGLLRQTAQRIAPGVREVRRVSRPLSRLLLNIEAVSPHAIATLRTLRTAAPQLNGMLALLTQRLPQLRSIATQSVEQLHCIRPYTPDIISWFSTWGGIMSGFDGVDRYLRANVEVPLAMPTNAESRTPKEAVDANPGLTYAFPRPPGYNAGQPWFLPECGAGPEALDPAADPEIRNRYELPAGSQP